MYLILDDIDEVNDPVLLLRLCQVEDVVLVTPVRRVVRLDLQRKSVEINRWGMIIFLRMAQPGLFSVYILSFHMTNVTQI